MRRIILTLVVALLLVFATAAPAFAFIHVTYRQASAQPATRRETTRQPERLSWRRTRRRTRRWATLREPRSRKLSVEISANCLRQRVVSTVGVPTLWGSGPSLSLLFPLFTRVRGRGILRTSPLRSSRKCTKQSCEPTPKNAPRGRAVTAHAAPNAHKEGRWQCHPGPGNRRMWGYGGAANSRPGRTREGEASYRP
jgi:hypothetical protein